MDEKRLKRRLLEENEEFRKTFEEHQSLEREIEKIRGNPHPTEAESFDERELKKKKLVLKDKLYRMMADFGKGL